MYIHFIDVGCGNMTVILFPNRKTYLYDCNVTDENEDAVLSYLETVMGQRAVIDAFTCSHRDADHMRGIKKIHAEYPIQVVWDPGVEGTTTDSPEYRQYMALRRDVGSANIKARTYREVEGAAVRWMNSQDDRLADANDQSIVMKVEYAGRSVLLAGDTSYLLWKEIILPFYGDAALSADILLASHHGSLSFFDDPGDEKAYYTAHIKKIGPAMTLVSVGPNVHDLPDQKAIELYQLHSRGSDKGNKVYTTEEQGNMKLTLKSSGGWNLQIRQ